MPRLPDDLPVLVGVGVAADGECEAAELMARAAEAAGADAAGGGAARLLAAVDRIAVPQGTWGYPDPGRLVAARVGAARARTVLGEVGVPQQTLVTSALQAVAGGHSDVALVVGGEARAWAKRQAREGRPADETAQPPGTAPDEVCAREPDFVDPAEVAAGLVVPVQQYAMIENALGHAEGLDPLSHRHRISALWARFNGVAGHHPGAAFPEPRSADRLDGPGGANYPLAFPYRRWHASQWTVDQAAALLVCTLGTARRLGVPPDRVVFPLVGLDAGHGVSLSHRAELSGWPAMGALGRAAAAHVGGPLAALEVAEVYSCFPAAVRVQQRELGLPLDGTPTVTGGMAFAGGPFNNFTYQATHAVVDRLRRDPAARGLVTTVCGLLTKPGLAVWSCTPHPEGPLLADLAAEARAATATVPVDAAYRGPATVATYTVTYEGDRPDTVKVVADTPAGTRCVAACRDPALAAAATVERLIGTAVAVDGPVFSA